MERKTFIKSSLGFLGAAVAAPALLRAGTAKNIDGGTVDDCTVSPTETEGPFPTITPSNWVRTDITDGRTGVAFTIDIYIKNKNAGCSALEGAIVDIWHCDKDGNYSEYGGSGMQPTNYTSVHFLRGRQTTNSEGLVSFTSIFPGWYTSRATHIHVHIYNSSGTSLLITQIAFPEGTNSAVNQVNAATSYGYTKGMNGYTYNANDNVFSDDDEGIEIASVEGSVSDGFALTHTIYVNGPTLGVGSLEQQQYGLGQNYPNPLTDSTIIPLNLQYDSSVNIAVYDMAGRRVLTAFNGNLAAGENNITLNRSGLNSGYYLYKVTVENQDGRFEESKKMLVK
ncbi:T9SS type A sorting domain-containing protein [Flavobacterium akiainvivens]|uniref:T9SS type A sorting domain-containing protein n=1 Tax=Flavobacterium akiainvivens TaxID=1202724 RepID=UPI0008F3FED2|nr:T9SS type A sorting domain-containing protein [Flavobacterium akiainvivens]SFQ14646.1 Por secretion system C-terminal sorting domain-containing protein [Flavobacterium akiainvivens]